MTFTVDLARAARLILGIVALVLLTSIGGAGIYAAPVTLPLLWVAAWQAGPALRAFLNLVAVLTAGELCWAFGYAAGGLWVWVLPIVGMVAVTFGYPLSQRALRR